MFDKILVGLDGSKHSLRAVKVAAVLAKQFDAQLLLLTVTRPYKVSNDLKRYLQAENLLGEPKYVLDEMTNDIISEARDITRKMGVDDIHTDVKEGRPARTIVEYAKRRKVDLVVLGSRGVGEVEAALLGSVSQKVTSLCHCKVMVVR